MPNSESTTSETDGRRWNMSCVLRHEVDCLVKLQSAWQISNCLNGNSAHSVLCEALQPALPTCSFQYPPTVAVPLVPGFCNGIQCPSFLLLPLLPHPYSVIMTRESINSKQYHGEHHPTALVGETTQCSRNEGSSNDANKLLECAWPGA